jgi:hypothetical protein
MKIISCIATNIEHTQESIDMNKTDSLESKQEHPIISKAKEWVELFIPYHYSCMH